MTAPSSSNATIVEIIQHYQRNIDRWPDDRTRLLHCITKLFKLPISLKHLQETGIGKTVNALRKFSGEIGVSAKALVAKWKIMVAEEGIVWANGPQHYTDMLQQPPNGHASSDDDNEGDNARVSTDAGIEKAAAHSEKPKISDTQHTSSTSKSRSKEKEKEKNRHRQSQRQAKESDGNEHVSDHRKEKPKATSKHRSSLSSHHHHSEKRHSEKTSSRHHKSRHEDRDKHEQMRKERRKETRSADDKAKKDLAGASSSSSSRHREKSSRSTCYDRGDRDSSKSKEKHSHHGGQEKSHHHQAREKENKRRSDSKERHQPSVAKDKEKHDDSKKSKDAKRDRDKSAPKDKEETRDKRKSSSGTSSSPSRSNAKPTAVVSPQVQTARSPSSPARPDRKRPHDADESSRDDEPSISAKNKVRKLAPSENQADDDGIDSSMGANFADVLGMLNIPTKKSKKSLHGVKSSTASTSGGSSSTTPAKELRNSTSHSTISPSKFPKTLPPVKANLGEKPELLLSAANLAPLDPSIALALPTISTNYRPLPLNPTVMDCVFNSGQATAVRLSTRVLSDAEALHHGISSKTMRTKIYSGVKTGQILQVPSLFDLCIRVLQKNIDALEYTGGVPFEVLRPVLDRATPQQLLVFEDFNPYLMEDSDDLWRVHCQRNYRTQKRLEMESWREMYIRCQEDQERKLSILAETIKQSQKEIAAPVRKTQLAFVDSMVKPPRNVQRKQEQFGTKAKLIATPASRVASLSSVTPNAARTGDARLRVAASVRDPASVGASQIRPKKAPLMAKALQLMRGRQNR